MSIIKKIYYAIINFFKIIITLIINIFTSIFTTKNTKTQKNEKKEIIELKQISKETPPESSTPSSLPDTNPILSNPETSTSSNIDQIVLKINKNNVDDTSSQKTNKRNIPWTDEELDKMFNDILEEEYDIEVKYTKYTLKDEIEKLKIKLQPKIENKIIYYEADRKPKLHDVMKKVIMEELKEKPIKELEPYKKKTKLQDEIYIITRPIKKEPSFIIKENVKKEIKEEPIKNDKPITKEKNIKEKNSIDIIEKPILKEIPKIIEEKKEDIQVTNNKPIITNIPIEKKEIIKKETEEKPFIITPVIDTKPKINLKAEISNTIKASSTIIANAGLELVSSIIEPTKKDEKMQDKETTPFKEIVKDSEIIQEELQKEIEDTPIEEQQIIIKDKKESEIPEEEIKEEIHNIETKESIKEEIKPVIVDIIPNQKIPDLEEIIKEKEEETQEIIEEKEKETTKEKEPEKEKEKPKKEELKEEIKFIPIINLNPIINEEDKLEEEIEIESLKEDIEEKDYDAIEDRINSLLDQLENFLIKNEKYLSTRQKNKIYNEQDRLRNLKSNLYNKKEQDITNEKISLEENISFEELTGLKKELQKIKLEHQLDLHDSLIDKVEDLDKLTKSQADKIEEKLIKQKIRKALRIIEIPAILSFPFIKNKYFRYFTAGLFINNHFNFLHGVLRHQTTDISLPDMNNIRKGRDALDKAIDLSYENIEYLNYLENEIISKYPHLSKDNEYLSYINNLKIRLNNNYEKLTRKQESIENHLSKINRNSKKLKRKRYYQNIDGQAA